MSSSTITMPSMTDTNMPNYINDLSNGIPNYFDAYQGMKDLPGQIDNWADESIKRQRATGDQVTALLGQVGEQRAGSGIMGGTEAQNLRSNTINDLNKIILGNQDNILNQATQMKANTIASMPSMAMMPVDSMANLYSLNSNDQHFWASLAADMLNTGY